MIASHPAKGRLTRLLATIGFVLMYLPVLATFYLSGHDQLGPNGASLNWDPYGKLFSSAELRHAFAVSAGIAGGSALITVSVGMTAALVVWRGPRALKRVIMGAMAILLVIPDLVLGIGLLMGFGRMAVATGPQAIVFAHGTASLALVVTTLVSRLKVFDVDILDAARDLGARPAQVFRHVILPLLTPGLIGSGLLAVTYSFDDFILGFLLGSPGSDSATLPVTLYAMTRFHPRAEIFALGALMMGPALLWAGFRMIEGLRPRLP